LPQSKVNIVVRRIDENHCEFLLEGVTPAVANALRRALLSDVPTLAIDEVAIAENSSVLFDEILTHRLALIPLRVDEDTYEVLLQCYEEGRRNDCTALFSLDISAEKTTTVYSGHLKFQGFTGGLPSLAAVDVRPVSDLIPIVKLAPGQKVVLEAYARMGVGREHAKWQPVSVAAYKYYPRVLILREDCPDCKACAEACPKGVLKVEGGRLRVVKEKIEECTMCRACSEACPGIVEVSWDDRKFIFKVEGVGVLPVRKVVEVAMRRIIRRADVFLRKVNEALLSPPSKSKPAEGLRSVSQP